MPSNDDNYCACGDEISIQRWNLGYKICLKCGNDLAELEKKDKAERSFSPGNKMGAVYVGNDPKVIRQALLDAGRKSSQTLDSVHQKTVAYFKPIQKQHNKIIRKKQIGFYQKNGERIALFTNDIPPKDAYRRVYF